MFNRTKTFTKTESRTMSETRLDKIRRWATEGARSFSPVQEGAIHVPTPICCKSNPVLYRRSWFGCNGANTGYTSSGVSVLLKNQITGQIRISIIRALLPAYSRRFRRIDVKRTCEILQTLGNGQDKFHWKAADVSPCHYWTPDQLSKKAKNLNYNIVRWYATSVEPINFTGGPPDKWQLYTGSLFTLLIDRLAVAVLLGGIKSLESIIQPGEKYDSVN